MINAFQNLTDFRPAKSCIIGIGIGLFSLAARSWINTMNITKYKKGKNLGLMSIVECQYQCKITDCT